MSAADAANLSTDTAGTASSPVDDASWRGPAAVLTWSPSSGVFVSASAVAERLWGATSGSLAGATLDRAMPGLARLAALAPELLAERTARTEQLVFWTVRGSQNWHCRITAGPNGDALAIEVLAANTLSAPNQPPRRSERAPPHNQDAETLAAIARQIRARMAEARTPTTQAPAMNGSHAGAETPDAEVTVVPTTPAVHSADDASLAWKLVEVLREPAVLIERGNPRPNAACLALLNEPSVERLAVRGGLAEAMPELTARLAAPDSATPFPLTLQARGQPPQTVTARLTRLAPGLQLLQLAIEVPNGPDLIAATDQRQSELFAKVSHEVRTPLSSIIGFAEVMRDEALGPLENPRYRGYVLDMLESARHALSLIDDLLDWSRVRAGALQLDFVELDLGMTCRAALQTLTPQVEKAGVTLVTAIADDLPHIIADKRSIKQMLLNLVSNAIKFTPAGGTITVRCDATPDLTVRLSVADTGEGMTADEVQVALLPFRQTGAQPGRAGGTGLGLPLTKALADANGAELKIESRPGHGTTAIVTFPSSRTVPV